MSRTSEQIFNKLYGSLGHTLDQIAGKILGAYEASRILAAGPGCKYTAIQAALQAALEDGATIADPHAILGLPGATLDYGPDQAVRVMLLEALHYPREAVVLQNGGTYDTIKKAADAAGNSPILVIPDHIVGTGGFASIAAAIADASVMAGHIILIKEGTHAETNLDVSKPVHLVGQSRAATIINAAGIQFSEAASIANLTLNSTSGAKVVDVPSSDLYAYNVDAHVGSGGFYDQGFLHTSVRFELRNCRVYSDWYGCFATGQGTLTLLLDNCYLESAAALSACGVFSSGLVDACEITARNSIFASIGADESAGAVPCVSNPAGSLAGVLDHCYILEDLSVCESMTGGETTGLLVSDALDDLSLIDCVISVLLPDGYEATQAVHLKRSSGLLRHVNTTVPAGQTLNTSGSPTAAYKIDPLVR